ncbi:MAG: hypothetical protein V1492_02595 [Candidatus Micrarchaeota archaeon]
MDDRKRAAIYLLMLGRYKDLINEKETKTITEIRSLINPRHPFIEQLRKKMIPEDYSYEKNFSTALSKAVEYMRAIETCEFAVSFWMTFEEMDKLEAADTPNKSLLFASLLRSFGAESTRVLVTKSGAYYVTFLYDGRNYLFSPKNNSLLAGDDVSKLLAEDSPRHSFNDVVYENFE